MKHAFALALVAALSTHAFADPSPPGKVNVELLSLDLMRKKGILTEAEYQSALDDLRSSVGHRADDTLSLVIGRWSTTLYGFLEEDNIVDTTQSFTDLAGNGQVARPGTYANGRGRLTMSVRFSRFGFRIRAPEVHRVRASALLEMDFLGNQPTTVTEAQFFTNPTLRVRHFMLRLETPIVDVLVGQTWSLFGWQSIYQPNAVEISGLPGELFSRTPQIRVSKTLVTKHVTLEAAIAALRPPQRDSWTPEGQSGLRLAFTDLSGLQTVAATGTSLMPASIAVSATVRRFALAEFSAAPTKSTTTTGWGIAADGFVPLVPARLLHRLGNLALHAEYAYGYGIQDQYQALTGGVTFPTLPNLGNVTPAPSYTADVDPGMVTFDTNGFIHAIQLQTVMVGAQYYVPRLDGRLWISTNVSYQHSNNSANWGKAAAIRRAETWFDVNLMGDVLPSVRLGLEYARFADRYADGALALNHRVQLSVFYLF